MSISQIQAMNFMAHSRHMFMPVQCTQHYKTHHTLSWTFEQPVVLPARSHKQMTIYAPYFVEGEVPRGFEVTLWDTEHRNVARQWITSNNNEIKPGDIFIGVLGSANTDLNMLQSTILPGQGNGLEMALLDARSFPEQEVAIENFDVLLLQNFPIHTLNSTQLMVLQTWVNRGGILIEIGGSRWQQNLQGLPASLLPVRPHGTEMLTTGTQLLPIQPPPVDNFRGVGPYNPTAPQTTTEVRPLSEDKPITVNIGTLYQSEALTMVEVLAGDEHRPLIVKAHQGSGIICYLGFDPTMEPLNGWSGTPLIWQYILSAALDDRLLIAGTAQTYDSGPGQILTRGGILRMIEPSTPGGTSLLHILLTGYIVLLALLCLIPYLRYIRRRHTYGLGSTDIPTRADVTLSRRSRHLQRAYFWRGRILLGCIILFSASAYGLAYFQKQAAATSNTISLLQINQDGNSAHITTMTGLLTPTHDNFQFHIPGQGLSEPISSMFTQSNPFSTDTNDLTATISTDASGNTLQIHNQAIWAFNPFITEQDQALPGRLSTHLQIQNNRVVGTITNTLPTTLTNLYLLFPHTFVDIGQIAARQTRHINLPLHSSPGSEGKTLADQIDEYQHLPIPYFPYLQKQRPETSEQYHLAILSALTGTGFHYDPCQDLCLTHTIVKRGVIYSTGGQVPNPNLKMDYDPLLIPGAQATLIGWVDPHGSGLVPGTTEQATSSEQQMQFLQMPLKLDFSEQASISPNLVTGNMTTIQSYDVQALLPGIYGIYRGSVTFDLPVPYLPPTNNRIIVNVPDLLAHPQGPGSNTPSGKNNFSVQFYNWQTGLWDHITLSQDTCTLSQSNPYTGPNRHLLIDITDLQPGQIYFGKPYLTT